MGVPKVWLNCDELVDLFKAELEPLLQDKINNELDLDIFGTACVIMNEIYDLIPEDKFKDLAKKIEDIIVGMKYSGEAHVEGLRVEIPPLRKDYDIIWHPPERIMLTGIQTELTGWKSYDLYSLIVKHYEKKKLSRTQTIMEKVPFKELGEHKILPIDYPFGTSKKTISLGPDDDVIFRIHNKSGNSRQTYLDFEYLTLGNLPPSGPTALFLDVSGSMWNFLNSMAQLMVRFLQNLYGTDPVTICFVAGIGFNYKRGQYDYIRKNFPNKYRAIEYLSDPANVPHRDGGQYDIVTAQCIMDYKLTQFTNYIVCTDQRLDSDPDPSFETHIKNFFTEDQYTFSIPIDAGQKAYWEDVYTRLGIFKPILN
jgi:hypothetical protein